MAIVRDMVYVPTIGIYQLTGVASVLSTILRIADPESTLHSGDKTNTAPTYEALVPGETSNCHSTGVILYRRITPVAHREFGELCVRCCCTSGCYYGMVIYHDRPGGTLRP